MQAKRELLTGEYVRVVDAKRDLPLTFTATAIEGAQATATDCLIARQVKLETGHYAEVYRSVAFVQVAPKRVLRYELKDTGKLIMQVNDINASALTALNGKEFLLKRPAKSHTLAAHRASAKKYKKTGRKGKPRPRKLTAIATALQVRGRATAWMKHS